MRILVNDWEHACQFYEHRLGLPVTFKDASLGWAEFDLGGPHLGLERVADDDDEGQALIGRFLGISLQVDDIADAYEQLKAQGCGVYRTAYQATLGRQLGPFPRPGGQHHHAFGLSTLRLGPGWLDLMHAPLSPTQNRRLERGLAARGIHRTR